MDAQPPLGLLRHFEPMNDPRHHNVHHRLADMIAIAILAVICGAENWTEVARFGRAKAKWLATFLGLPQGVPSHDTFGRLFARLDPMPFERCLMSWAASVAESSAGTLVAIDGKTIRRSFDRASKRTALHMINAWCGENRLVLGQLATEAKDNEITAIPKLLKLTLDEAIALNFADMPHDFVQTVDGDHGRIETRRLWCTSDIDWLPGLNDWRGLGSVAVLECVRQVGDQRTTQRRYYISSLPGDDAATLLKAVRGHWGVENQLHWSLDVSFGEDASRIRHGHAAENFSRLRRFALNLLARDRTSKIGKKAKAKACGWDHDYLLSILTQN